MHDGGFRRKEALSTYPVVFIEPFQEGHRSGDGRLVGARCEADGAPRRLSEIPDVSTLVPGRLVG